MKKCLFLFVLWTIGISPISAQFVQVPDPNLREALKSLYSECFTEDFLQSSCPSITYATHLNINALGITDPEGLQYFKNLIQLDCSSNYLTHLPELPKSLVVLHCDYNSLTKLPSLPDSLIYLECNNNPLGSLPALPKKLRSLSCYHNQLTSLPALPDSLKGLYCDHNFLTRLPALPNGMESLWCYYNALTTLPSLPSQLTSLQCGGNRLSQLPALPEKLGELSCWGNFLTQLPALPKQLTSIECGANELGSLPVLPASLQSLDCSSNKLFQLPCLPTGLLSLNCANNYLSILDVPSTTSVSPLYASYNCFHDVNVSVPSLLSSSEMMPLRSVCSVLSDNDSTALLSYHLDKEELMVNAIGSQYFYFLNHAGELIHHENVEGQRKIHVPHLKPGIYYYGLGKNKDKLVIYQTLPF